MQMQEIDDGHWSMDVNNKNFLAVATHYIARCAGNCLDQPIVAIDSFINGMVARRLSGSLDGRTA